MAPRASMYALLAIAGLVVPWYFNLTWIAGGGGLLDIGAVLALAFANPIASAFSVDLLIAFVTFFVWAFAEGRRIGMRRAWIYPLLGLLIAFAFAYPLFLFARERHLQRTGASR